MPTRAQIIAHPYPTCGNFVGHNTSIHLTPLLNKTHLASQRSASTDLAIFEQILLTYLAWYLYNVTYKATTIIYKKLRVTHPLSLWNYCIKAIIVKKERSNKSRLNCIIIRLGSSLENDKQQRCRSGEAIEL